MLLFKKKFFLSILFSFLLKIFLNIELKDFIYSEESFKESEEIIYNNINSSKIIEVTESNSNQYKGELNGESENNIELILFDSLTYQNSKNLKFKGLEFGIIILAGDMKIYKYLCKTYPDCTTITKKNSIELISINTYISEVFEAYEIANLKSNEKNYIFVICEEKENNICKYEIIYHRIEGYRFLWNDQRIIKYLGNSQEDDDNYQDDKYIIFLRPNTRSIIDLIVYSGDAFIIMSDGSFNDYDCNYVLENIGLNQKWIFTCNDTFQFKYRFHVRANEYGAVYSIYFQQISLFNEEKFPLEMTTMHSLNFQKKLTIKPYNEEINSYYTIFNPINCDLKIKANDIIDNKIMENQDIIVDYGIIIKGHISYTIENKNKNNDNKCLFSMSSFHYNREDSFIILTESNPFSAILNSKFDKIRMLFPYATSEQNPKILIRITLYEISPFELIIKVGSNPEKKMDIFQSTDILISNETYNNLYNLTYKRICPIKIIVKYLGNKNNNLAIDVKIKTMSNIPYLIKPEKYFPDMDLNLNKQYYLAILNKNSKGFISLNFRRGAGYAIGKIIFNYIRGNDGKIDISLQNSENSLEYDALEQKLFYEKKQTEKCNNFCYLIFEVHPTIIYNNAQEYHTFSEYYLIFKNNQNENNIKYINIPNDEFILGNINTNEIDYYQFNFPKKISILRIDFESDNCQIILSFNTDDFINNEKIIKYEGNGENQIFEINKNDFISFYDEIFESNLNIKIKIELKYQNSNFSNTKYKLRITANIDILRNITTIDTSLPVYCDKSIIPINKENYCDYLMSINEINYYNLVELYAFSEKKERKLEIYAKIVDSNYFMKLLYKENYIIEWPNRNNFTYSNINSMDLMNLNILKFNLHRNYSYKILIRVYINGNFPVTLISNLINQHNYLLPIPFYQQIMHINKNFNNGLMFDLSNSYNLHFHLIEKNNPLDIQINSNKYSLLRIHDRLIVNANNNKRNLIIIRNDHNDNNNICFLRYYKINKNLFFEKINIGIKNEFIYDRPRKEFLYFAKVEDIEGNIFFNSIFNELSPYNQIDQNIHNNFTEIFEIIGYLLTKTQMNNLSIESMYMNELNLALKIYNGIFDCPHKQGNFIIPKEDIIKFKNEINEDIYIFISIKTSSENKLAYKSISLTITLLQDNEKFEPVPPNTHLTNYFKKHTTNVQHYYKIEKTKDDNKDIILEFSSTDKNIKFELLDSNKKNELSFEIIKSQEEIGKKLIKIKNEFNEAFLLVKRNNFSENNIFYTFKYYFRENYTFLYKYNPNATYVYINDDLLSITIDKIKYFYSGKITKCNYYFRLYEIIKENINDYNILTSLNGKNPYYTFKIFSSDSSLNDKDDTYVMKIPIPFENGKKYFIDIIAETLSKETEYLAYKRLFPNKKDDKSDNKKIYIIVLSIIGVIIICASILIIFIFIYKKDNNNLKNNIEKISFFSGEQKPGGNSTTFEDDNIDDDGIIF